MDLRCQHLKSWLPSFPSPELPKLTSLLIIWPQIWRSCCKSLGEQATILSPGLQLLKLMANLSQIQQQHMDESKDFSNSLGAPFELLFSAWRGDFKQRLWGSSLIPDHVWNAQEGMGIGTSICWWMCSAVCPEEGQNWHRSASKLPRHLTHNAIPAVEPREKLEEGGPSPWFFFALFNYFTLSGWMFS